MRRLILSFILFISILHPLFSQKNTKNLTHLSDSLMIKKRPFKAAIQTVGINLGIWGFDRYVLKGDYAYISWESMWLNIRSAPVWDTDQFSTNLLFHPLHGSLYYNAARSNGLNFWESTPYALGGSVMWEYLMENERPSINDLFSTPIGGIALGEISYRLSSLILDDTKRGGARVWRELLGAVASPMRAFTRFTDGDTWKVRRKNSFNSERSDFHVKLSSGWRYLQSKKNSFATNSGLYIATTLNYSDPFGDDSYTPYQFFTARLMVNIISQQNPLAAINTTAIIWGKTTNLNANREVTWGIFQYYDFFQTNAMENVDNTPFELAHTAALGPGMMVNTPKVLSNFTFNYNLFPKVILMGGTLTDYWRVNERDYDLGMGYATKIETELKHKTLGYFALNAEYSQIYTWNNSMGNEGNTLLTIISPNLTINIMPKVSISFSPEVYVRHSFYKHLPNQDYFTYETRLALNWIL